MSSTISLVLLIVLVVVAVLAKGDDKRDEKGHLQEERSVSEKAETKGKNLMIEQRKLKLVPNTKGRKGEKGQPKRGPIHQQKRGEELHRFRCRTLMNGCSNAGLFRSYENTFKPACNVHDVCYACGIKYGLDRKICDQRFYANMVQICKKKKFTGCYSHALLYYYGSKLFGQQFYNLWGHSLCYKKCVRVLLRV